MVTITTETFDPSNTETEPMPSFLKGSIDRPHFVGLELIDSGWINKYILTYQLPNGELYAYESVSRKGPEDYEAELRRIGQGETPKSDAVGIVPVLEDGSLLFIREFRYPLNSWCVSFPAGLIDEGEDAAEAIERELREETGYRLRKDLGDKAVQLLPQAGFSSTGLTEESVQIAIAQVEPDSEAEPEPTEFIEPFIVKGDALGDFLDQNRTPISTRCQLMVEMLANRREYWLGK